MEILLTDEHWSLIRQSTPDDHSAPRDDPDDYLNDDAFRTAQVQDAREPLRPVEVLRKEHW
jgi:hypothetical protein